MSPILPAPSGNLHNEMLGIWWLLSRTDWTQEGQLRIDPILGRDPVGILSYATTHFAAQFSRRDRAVQASVSNSKASQNNTAALDGYDAYFGTYEVNESTGIVAHTLIGSVVPSNVGLTVFRDLRVQNDQLTIQLTTTSAHEESIIRTLVWKRMLNF
ncbi:lipocalin-like domain-containing protein [Dyadobacter sp. CY261]|uniref:lipocalin-like domain-containing protein n=1 Tax=Dyadobacter sp. CY261 TaxID=2907203 RepID=UPI001F3AA47F|nr:lipocalin-like domain-containing protein [Dyadobacter sp. CY261]MCF0074962.1 lipocalin-like domain-containing protein [Dyadobacter sp. CY261]